VYCANGSSASLGVPSSRKSKAFDTQLAKLHYADCTRTMAERLISDMTLKVLGCDKGHALSELRHIILQVSSPG
jgi:hypothetical protein